MRKILLLILAFLPILSHSQPSMFAGYDAFCGLPVVVEPTSQDAVATIRNNTRIIIVDPSVMSNWKLSRIYALAHECGHHVLGHLSLHELFSRQHMNATSRQELSADCWAAEMLVRNGYRDEVYRAISDNERQGPFNQGAYPSGTTRAAFMAECAGIRLAAPSPPLPSTDIGPTPQCLATMDERCMKSCQFQFNNSYDVCRNQMCNSPRQRQQNINRCTK